jgi:hypothetical protein
MMRSVLAKSWIIFVNMLSFSLSPAEQGSPLYLYTLRLLLSLQFELMNALFRDLEFIHLLPEHSTFYHFQIQTHVSCHSTVMSPRTSNEILLSNVSTVSTGSFCSPKPPITSTCTQYFGELQGVRSVFSRDCLLIVSIHDCLYCTCVCKKSFSPVICLFLSLIGVILSPATTTELAFVTSSERKFVCDVNTSSRQGCERQKR